MATKVSVTADDIAAGVARDCVACPVALAVGRATGDDHASIHERDWTLRVEVWGRSIVAPYEVRMFVNAFDGHLERKPKPFEFELPDDGDPEWEETCYKCEELCDPSELDDEGVCSECLKGQS